MEISGHKTEAVYRRYDIISRQDLTTAAARMEHYLGTLSGTPKGVWPATSLYWRP